MAHTNGSKAAREIALIWLNQFCVYYGKNILDNLSAFLLASLQYLHDEKTKAAEVNQRLSDLVDFSSNIHLESVLTVLLNHLQHEQTDTRIASLNWIRLLQANKAQEMFNHMDKIFPVLLDLLLDSADDVLMLDIMLITDVCSSTNQNQIDMKKFDLSEEVISEFGTTSPYLVKFCLSLLELCKADPKLIDDRGIQIVR